MIGRLKAKRGQNSFFFLFLYYGIICVGWSESHIEEGESELLEGEDDNSMSSVVENVSDLELVRAGTALLLWTFI